MEGLELLRILYGTFLGLFLIAMGFLTFTAKDEPGIGFRVGYTYLSKRARRKANRVSGIGTMITGLGLMVLSPFLSMSWLMAFLLLSSGTTMLFAYLVAKREYELEELSEKAPGKPGKAIEPPKVGKYIILQLMLLALSFALILAGKLPRDSGFPIIALLQLFLPALTLLVSRPLVFQLAPRFKGKMAIGFARAMTIASGTITLQLVVVALKPNASPLVGIIMLFVSLGAIFYAVLTSLISAHE